MSKKHINPQHDPVPDYEHKRHVSAESDNFTFISYMPQDQYGFIRIVHHARTGDSTGYLDITTDTTAGKEHPAIANLYQLQDERVTLYDVALHVNSHNNYVRRYVKKDFTDFEVAQQIAEKKRAQEEAAKPKILTVDEQRAARNYRATACKEADYKVKQTDERLRRLHHWQARANGYKQQADDLTALGADQSLIDSQQAQYGRFQALCDTNRDEYHANHEKAVAEAKAAYAKTAREYYEEAHQHA